MKLQRLDGDVICDNCGQEKWGNAEILFDQLDHRFDIPVHLSVDLCDTCMRALHKMLNKAWNGSEAAEYKNAEIAAWP